MMEDRIVSATKHARILISVALLLGITFAAAASGEFDRISEIGIDELRVESLMLGVEIRGGSRLNVEGWGKDIPDHVKVEYERRGSVLHVWVKRRFSLFSSSKGGMLFFDVPRGIDLEIQSSSGSVDIEGMNSDRLVAGSSSGDVRVSDIRSRLDAHSSSGNIVIDEVQGDVRAESSSGNMDFSDITGDVVASASSGSLKAYNVRGDVELSASSGRIELDSTKGSVDARTTSGNMEGEDVWITGDSIFHSSSGRIDMDFDNPLSAFSFRLSSSSGGLHAGDVSGQKSLVAGTGVFRITGETSSGSQRYK
jgi:hypothetical protein